MFVYGKTIQKYQNVFKICKKTSLLQYILTDPVNDLDDSVIKLKQNGLNACDSETIICIAFCSR